jgi:HEAT repeat protein/MFS family permease
MQSEPTTIEKLRGLRWSIYSNVANTVFSQFTYFGSIFILFLSALGLNKSQMGFLLSLMQFTGLIAIFVAPWTERFGLKRTYVTFFCTRTAITLGLLLTPFVANLYGPQVALIFVTLILGAFSIARAVGVTASYPWIQEYVPSSVQGKYTATNNIFTTITGFVAVAFGSWVLANTTGLNGYVLLIAIGVVFGFISVAFAALIPGGAPRFSLSGETKRDLMAALRDSPFVRYLLGVGLITVAAVPLGSFLPLFMQEQVKLTDSQVVWLQTASLAGTLLSSYLWGWAADRYGSIPVTLYGVSMRVVLSFFWMLIPRGASSSFYVAWGISFLQGVADMGWGIGSGRLLYVSVVPPAMRTDYMALFYAFTGIVGGISQLFGGRLLDASQGLSGQIGIFTLDPYVPLFFLNIILPSIAFFLLWSIHEEKGVGVGKFTGIFLRGNPFLAMSSMIRFYLARDEHSTVRMTERLGQAKSPLTVDELLSALEDPRFNVRFEAVVSIGRMPPDTRLIDALIEILEGRELALTVVAAWALGRSGDRRAIEPLRRALDSSFRSIRAHSARALGALDDKEIAPVLLERLAHEEDKGLQMAYASALGNLQWVEATPTLLQLLAHTQNTGARLELALTLARLIGDEHYFVSLLRQMRSDPGTATAQALTTYRKRNEKKLSATAVQKLLECEDALARGEVDHGARLLGALIPELPLDEMPSAQAAILRECGVQLAASGDEHSEYTMLALDALLIDR